MAARRGRPPPAAVCAGTQAPCSLAAEEEEEVETRNRCPRTRPPLCSSGITTEETVHRGNMHVFITSANPVTTTKLYELTPGFSPATHTD
jgi:hypothetical protein